MSNVRAARDAVVEAARRFSRIGHEAEDLAHDILLSCLRRGTLLDSDAVQRSAHGAARRHGAFLARSAGRRRARESRYACAPVAHVGATAVVDASGGEDTANLPAALRTTLLLLLMELEKAELRVALGVTDAALRKRFQALRARSPLARPELSLPVRTPARNRVRRSQVELLPQLVDTPRAGRRLVAVSDPDGHGIIFSQVLTSEATAATTGVLAAQTAARS